MVIHKIDLSSIKQIPILNVAQRLDIAVRGKKAICFCGHDKRTPSLSFVPNKNFWKCFGCGKGGDEIGLVTEVLGCDFRTALEWFNREFSVNVRQPRISSYRDAKRLRPKKSRVVPKLSPINQHEQSKFMADPEIYSWLISKCGDVSNTPGLEYLKTHGIPPNVANKFGVRELREPARALRKMVEQWGAERVFRSGLSWGEHGIPERLIWTSYTLLFPFRFSDQVMYIQGRLFKGEPKYLNPRGVPKPLYNVYRLRSLPMGSIVHICEGVPDALALEAQRLPAVAVLGASSFRAEWVDLFMRYDVVLMPDGDRGGDTFLKTIATFFTNRGKAVRSVRLPEGKDVSDVIAEMGKRT